MVFVKVILLKDNSKIIKMTIVTFNYITYELYMSCKLKASEKILHT